MTIIVIYLFCALITISDAIVFNSSILDGKILNGEDVDDGTMKFIASLRDYQIHICTGTLISARHVITAGQCIAKVEDRKNNGFCGVTVIIGNTTLNIAQAEYHEKFQPPYKWKTRQFDIGLIMLTEIVFASNEIKISSLSDELISDKLEATIVGCKIQTHVGKPVIKKMKVIVGSHKTSKKSHAYCRFFDKRIQMCAIKVHKEQRIFREDAGSPLIWNNKVIGILTYVKNLIDSDSIIFVRAQNIIEYVKQWSERMLEKEDEREKVKKRRLD